MKILSIFMLIPALTASAEWLQYSSGIGVHNFSDPSELYGQRMSPATHSGTILNCQLFLFAIGLGGQDIVDISFWYYQNGAPTTMFYQQQFEIDDMLWLEHWYSFDINQEWYGQGTEFLIAVHMPQPSPNHTTLFYSDAEAGAPDRNWRKIGSGPWTPFSTEGDFMFGVEFENGLPAVEPASLGSLKAVYR